MAKDTKEPSASTPAPARAQYINPNVTMGAAERPRRVPRLRRLSGAWIAKEPFEVAVTIKDKAGNESIARRRYEIGDKLPASTPDEQLASLDAQKLIDPEYVDADDAEE